MNKGARASFLAAAMGIASVAGAQQTGQPTGAQTVQQAFDAATDLQDKGDNAGALAAWEALEKRVANARTRAVIQARKSTALLALDRKDEAAAAARASLTGMPGTDASLGEDRAKAYLALGRIAEASLDYASAAPAYATAETLTADPSTKAVAEIHLVETQTFLDPAAAAQALTRLEATIGAAKTDAKVRAIVKRLQGQLLLNQCDFAGSRKASGEAVSLLGGLTQKTDLNDVVVRSNFAIAALLDGRKDLAREYMAMTGAGRIGKGTFDPGPQMKVPECGGEAGLKPADLAVVEFSIDDDGVVRESAPVYAAGGGQVALEFARAARSWSWTPEQVKQLPFFFRHRARAELRCSTSFERPAVSAYLDGELGAWLADKKVELPPLLTGSDSANLPQLRARLAQVEAAKGRDALAVVPILHQMAANVVISRDEAGGLARRELAIVIANNAPPIVRLAIEPTVLLSTVSEAWKPAVYIRTISPLLTAPAYAGDPASRAAIRLMMADKAVKDERLSRGLLSAVDAEQSLPANHPLRVGALVRLASLEQRQGNSPAAAAAFAKSGLSAQQCAIIDSSPRLLGSNASSNDFPREALTWGFEGWAKSEFDISAAGAVVNQRTIVAYPPFVFSEAGLGIVKFARFEKSYRPDGGLGCGGRALNVNFRLPSH